MSPDRWPNEVANSARIDDSIPQKCLPSSSTTSTTTSTSTSSQNRCHSHFHHGVVGDRSVNYENDNKNKINNNNNNHNVSDSYANDQPPPLVHIMDKKCTNRRQTIRQSSKSSLSPSSSSIKINGTPNHITYKWDMIRDHQREHYRSKFYGSNLYDSIRTGIMFYISILVIFSAIQPIANGQQNDGTCQLKESYIL